MPNDRTVNRIEEAEKLAEMLIPIKNHTARIVGLAVYKGIWWGFCHPTYIRREV
jgi:hypothetical protein